MQIVTSARRLAFLVCLVHLAMSGSALGDPTSKEVNVTEIAELIEKIGKERSSNVRTQYAQDLVKVARRDPQRVDDKTIDDVAKLLSSNDDSVRYWAAGALGIFGPRATRAVPALEQALAEIKCSMGSKTSESGIRLALERITGKPSKHNC